MFCTWGRQVSGLRPNGHGGFVKRVADVSKYFL